MPESVSNVVVVVVDALRADRVGEYGSDKDLTPNIDKLCEDSHVFERAYACINTTDPSLTSVHTGHYPRSTVLHHGDLVTDEEKARIESIDLVPEILSENGITTFATGRSMGRWHRRGFDQYPQSTEKHAEAKISRQLKAFHPLLHRSVATPYNTVKRIVNSLPPSGERQDVQHEAVNEFLDNAERSSSDFYGFIHLMDTHVPYDPDSALVDELLNRYDYPDDDLETFFARYQGGPFIEDVLKEHATEEDYEQGVGRLCARYDGSVVEADRAIGQLVSGLREKGLWDETAVLVMSDHGESLVEHDIPFDHHGLYEESVHVPLILRLPGDERERVESFIQLNDIAPTILELFDIDHTIDAPAESVFTRMASEDERDAVFFEEAHTQRRVGVRTDDWKYICSRRDEQVEAKSPFDDPMRCRYCNVEHGTDQELYDMKNEGSEAHNLANDNPAVVEELEYTIESFVNELDQVGSTEESPDYEDEEELLERLEDLGYK